MVKRELDYIGIFRIFLGIVFLSAAIYRIINFNLAEQELVALAQPANLAFILIIFELFLAYCFLFDKFIKIASLIAIIFLVYAIIVAFAVNGEEIMSKFGELFIFNATITDIALHITFILAALFLYLNIQKKK